MDSAFPQGVPLHLGRIVVYPIKSLDGVAVSEAAITAGGFLEHDRVYAIVDQDGKVVNGKRDARVHRLRSRFDAAFGEVHIAADGTGGETFPLAEPDGLNRWLSSFFGFGVRVQADALRGFPDDREAFGPTVVGEASLRAVARWFPDLDLASVRGRFRANLELVGPDAPPFCEDELFGAAGELRPFAIGPVQFRGHNPCQRCVVPTRDPRTGEAIAGFQKRFMELRRETLPPWANPTRFNHFYRFTINTSVPPTEAGKRLRVGDALSFPAVSRPIPPVQTAAR